MALLISADDSIRKLSPQDLDGSRDNEGVFSLADMQQMVGGYIQAVRLKEGANKRGNSSRLTQSFHFFMFEPI
ncbi:hypothetical protein OS120_25900, partial [Klebsiella pneumoniae]|nr:hypothetical protein [Klebsiella pneumoniae]